MLTIEEIEISTNSSNSLTDVLPLHTTKLTSLALTETTGSGSSLTSDQFPILIAGL